MIIAVDIYALRQGYFTIKMGAVITVAVLAIVYHVCFLFKAKGVLASMDFNPENVPYGADKVCFELSATYPIPCLLQPPMQNKSVGYYNCKIRNAAGI